MKGSLSALRVPTLGFAFALLGCGSSTITNPMGGADAPIIIPTPDAPVTLDARVSCSSAVQCAVGQTCNPGDNKCESGVPCTTNTQCGNQAFCQPDHTCAINTMRGPCDGDANCISDETCNAGHCGCDGQTLTATVVAPNMVIALDRSQSMTTIVTGSQTRWDVASTAMGMLATKYQNAIRFGLVLWPGTNKQCSGGSECMGIDDGVDVDFGNGMAITDYMASATKCSLGTPITGTLTALDSFAGLNDTTRANYVLLMTDGEQSSCTGDPGTAATALRNHHPEVKTFAVGFGSEAMDGADALNAIATNGGTARSGSVKYYQADSLADLEAAFDMIGGQIVSCDYTLSMDITDPTKVFVYLGPTQLARDPTHTNGWDFDTTSKKLTFYGTSCTDIKNSMGSDLSVSFGCPVIP